MRTTRQDEDEERETSRRNPATSARSAPGIEEARCYWTKQVRPALQNKEITPERKRKKTKNSLAPALRVSKRSLGTIVENYLDARENCLPACKRNAAVAPDDFQIVIPRRIGTCR